MVVEYSFLLSHLSLPLEELTLKLIVIKILWIEIQTRDDSLLFGVFYHSPNSDATVLDKMNAAISAIPGNQSDLCGDFNAPKIDWSLVTPTVSSPVNSAFCSLVHDNFLTQLVSLPTRCDHILDLILTNDPRHVSNVQVVDNLPGTDHDAVEFVLFVSSDIAEQPDQVLYNYSKADLHEFQEVLSHVPWDCIPTDNGMEYAWQCWKDLFFLRFPLLSRL